MFLNKKDTTTNNEVKIIDNIRALSVDMIHEASSGHPGIALGIAPALYTLYAKHLRINPSDPSWINRDRFILSAGHGSSLLYANLYMSGYDITLEDLKKFRQIDSKTPGHPEYKITPGVDMTTGPLGQGIASAVGMAIGETYLREYFNKQNIFDFYTYVLCSDGDLMEGVSYEALSLAGTLKLNKLIVLYDYNKICLDGSTNDVNNIDVIKYFNSLNWNVITTDGEDLNGIDNAISKAKESNQPSVIIINTAIGKYAKQEGTNEIHGKKLTEEDVTYIKNNLGIRDIPFIVSSEAKEEMQNMIHSRMDGEYEKWFNNFEKLPDEIQTKLNKIKEDNLSLDDISVDFELTGEETENLRESSSKILNSLAKNNPLFLGGSADLSSSILTKLHDYPDYSKDNHLGRNINYGVREHAMAAIQNGLTLVGIRNFSSTYLAFSDYLKPALRLACQMNLSNIYIFSHDSISVGKDGPTHQPVEQLVSLRATPNLDIFRPADINEMIGTYKIVAAKKQGPSVIVLGRNNTKTKENTSITEIKNGGYIVKKENKNISAIIISSGEELDIALDVAEILEEKGYDIRVVSMPSTSLFKKQKLSYQEEILPFGKKIFVIEASSSYSWYDFVYNDKYLITLDQFGLSGDKDDVLNRFGFTKEKIVEKIENILK